MRWYSLLFVLINSSLLLAQSHTVKTISETRFNQLNSPVKLSLEKFSIEGLLIQKSTLNNQSKLIQYIKYTHDSNKNLITDSTFNNSNYLLEVNTYNYDEYGTITSRKKWYTEDTLSYIETFKNDYDADSNLITQVKSINGKPQKTYVFQYNTSNKKVSTSEFQEGVLLSKSTFKYRFGLLNEEVYQEYQSEQKMQKTIIYHYGKKQKLNRKSIYLQHLNSSIKAATEYVYKYNENGLLQLTNVVKGGKIKAYFLNKYTYY